MATRTAPSDYNFGQIAIQHNFCSILHVRECLDIQKKEISDGNPPQRLGELLQKKGYISSEQATQIIRLQLQARSSKLPTIPGYEMIALIGRGGMGAVYKARQLSMDRLVAIKVLSQRYSSDRNFIERFLREARAVAKLNHRNIIGGIDVGETQGVHYFVMEFVQGSTVAQVLKEKKRFDEKSALAIAERMAAALDHAARHGMIHRDIKPENIMISVEGEAKLCDLGLAKQTNKDDSNLTMDGMSVGTPNYISPEQARGDVNLDIRADIYSLGASLYHMVTGSTPFNGPNPLIVMTKHVTEDLEPPKSRFPELSNGLNQLIVRMMRKERDHRYQTPGELFDDINRLMRGEPLATPRRPKSTRRAVVQKKTGRRELTRSRPTARFVREPLKKKKLSLAPFIIGGLLVLGIIGAFLLINPQKNTLPNGSTLEDNRSKTMGNVDPKLDKDIRNEYSIALKSLKKSKQQLGVNLTPQKLRVFWKKTTQFEDKFGSIQFLKRSVSQEKKKLIKSVNLKLEEKIWRPFYSKIKLLEGASSFLPALKKLKSFPKSWRSFDTEGLYPTGLRVLLQETKKNILLRIKQALKDEGTKLRKYLNQQKWNKAYALTERIEKEAGVHGRQMVLSSRKDILKRQVQISDQTTVDEFVRIERNLLHVMKLFEKDDEFVTFCWKVLRHVRKMLKKKSSFLQLKALEKFEQFSKQFEAALQRRDIKGAHHLASVLLTQGNGPVIRSILIPQSLNDKTLLSFLASYHSSKVDSRKLVRRFEKAILRLKKKDQTQIEMLVSLRSLLLIQWALKDCMGGGGMDGQRCQEAQTVSPPRFTKGLENFPGSYGEGVRYPSQDAQWKAAPYLF